MTKKEKTKHELSDELLEAVKNIDDFTTSDWQGYVEAFVMRTMKAGVDTQGVDEWIEAGLKNNYN